MESNSIGIKSLLKKYICLLIIHLFNLLPIKTNKVFLFSYYGSQYGCSPKYITEHILEHYPEGHFDLVWAFNEVDSKEYPSSIRKVKTMTLRYFYELCTSKVIITNFRTTDLFVKREGQYYIQTWHSSLRLKQIEKDAEDLLPLSYVEMAKKDSLKCDLLLSGCGFSTEIFRRAFWYDGPIFEHGTPRNDLFFEHSNEKRERILARLNIPSDRKVVLYAPTFRKGDSLEVYNLSFSKIIDSLKKRFGGDWVFLVKLHPHLMAKSSQLIKGKGVIDVTSYDDIQELLCISDFLISDYSSLMFDFAITQRPCFLYVPDLNEYLKNDRNLYFNLEELPFIHSKNNVELTKNIESFSDKEYEQKLEKFLNSIETYEDGKAGENLVTHINQICFGKDGRVENEAA